MKKSLFFKTLQSASFAFVIASLFIYPLIFVYWDAPLFSIGGVSILMSTLYNMVLCAVLLANFIGRWLDKGPKSKFERCFAFILCLLLADILITGLTSLKLNYLIMWILPALLFCFLRNVSQAKMSRVGPPVLMILFLYTTILGLIQVRSIEDLLGFNYYRWSGIFPGTNMVVSYYYALIAIGYMVMDRIQSRNSYIIMAVVSLTCCWLGQTRSYYIPATLIFVALYFMRRLTASRILVTLVLVTAFSLGLWSLVVDSPLATRFAAGLDAVMGREVVSYNAYGDGFYGGETYHTRYDLWRHLLKSEVTPATLLMGNGFGNTILAVGKYFGTRDEHPHSDWILFLLDFGVIGTAAYFWLLYVGLRESFLNMKKYIVLTIFVMMFEMISAYSAGNVHLYYQRMVFMVFLTSASALLATKSSGEEQAARLAA